MLGLLREVLHRGDTQGQPVFLSRETDRWTGDTLDAFVEIGVLGQPGAEGSHSWSIDVEALAAWVARSIGTECGSGALVPGRMWFLGLLRHYGQVREIFLARGLHWRDGKNVVRQSSRLLGSPCPVVLVFSELPPIRFWQDCSPVVGSIRELSGLQGCRLLIDRDLLFGLPRVPAGKNGRHTPDAEFLLTQPELDILRAIAAEPGRCMTLADAMAAGGYGKSATNRSLRRLREQGLIAKPLGTSRHGDAITAAGAAFLNGNRDSSQL